MKEVTTSSKAIPASPRSKNYPAGSTIVRTGGGNATITSPGGGGSNIDVLKTTDEKSMTDGNVLSALRTLLEIRSSIIASTDEETALSEENTLSSFRIIAEIDAAITEALDAVDEIYLSKTKADTAAEAITFLKGLFVGDNLAFINASGDAEVESLVTRMKAKVATLEVTGDATTLNLLVQELATIYDLDVTHVATMFRTIIEDYVSSETFIPGLMGEGMKIYKALNGDWNLEIDNVVIRKVMTIFELVVSKIRSVNGGLVISAANGRIKSVAETTGAPAYYVLGIEGDNQFVFDDLVRCQVFTSGHAKYYQVPVASVAADSILVLKSEFADGVVPVPGDDLIQMGNRTNKARQGLLYLTASEDGKPRFSVMDGVDSTSTVGKSKVILGCLDGMTDTDFPADFQPSGWGLYAMNVFLKGVFLLRNGKSVEGEIESAKSDAQTAKDKAELITELFQAFTVAGGVFESKITEVKEYTDDKADELQAQINTHSTSIKQNTKGIELKASQEQVNGIGSRLTSAEGSLTVQANQIASKVSNDTFNELGVRVGSAESAISQQADAIILMVKKDDLTTTGIDISNRKIVLTSDKVVFQNNSGGQIALFENDRIKADLIDARKIVTDVLSAEAIAATNLTVTGNSKIGGWSVSGNDLTCYSENAARIRIEIDGGKFFRINDPSDASLVIRNDKGNCLRLYNEGSGATALEITSQGGNSFAIKSAGSHKFMQRSGETWNAPGVLWCGRYNTESGALTSWGDGTASSPSIRRIGTGCYTVTHNIGHTQYFVSATPCIYTGAWNKWAMTSQYDSIGNSSFNLQFKNDGGRDEDPKEFTVIIYGRNRF